MQWTLFCFFFLSSSVSRLNNFFIEQRVEQAVFCALVLVVGTKRVLVGDSVRNSVCTYDCIQEEYKRFATGLEEQFNFSFFGSS